MKEVSEEEIRNLIKNGFDLELISFELEIPIEQIIKIRSEIKTYSANEIINQENEKAHLEMEKMRKRYNKIFFKTNKSEIKEVKQLSKEKMDLVNSMIAELQEIIVKMKGLVKSKKQKEGLLIISKLEKIENLQLTIEQAEKLYFLLQSEELEDLSLNRTDKTDIYIDKSRKMVLRKLAEAVEIEQEQTQSVEKLKDLKRKLPTKIPQNSRFFVDIVRSRIENKILKIQNQEVNRRMKTNIPIFVDNITKNIAKGTLDIKVASDVIQREAEKRVESKTKTIFSLTVEQEKRQILIQIRNLLITKPEEYSIENPEIAITQIQELFNIELEDSIKIVIKHLISIKKFDEAKEIFNKYFKSRKKHYQKVKFI